MNLVTRKPVFGVSDQVRHKLRCTAADNGKRIKILDFGSRSVDYTIYIITLKTIKGADGSICAFVFAYSKTRFSHKAAHTFFLLMDCHIVITHVK